MKEWCRAPRLPIGTGTFYLEAKVRKRAVCVERVKLSSVHLPALSDARETSPSHENEKAKRQGEEVGQIPACALIYD